MDGRAYRGSVLIAASRQKRARKPSARERVDEFVHKHPVGFAATVLLGGAIIGATAAGHASAPAPRTGKSVAASLYTENAPDAQLSCHSHLVVLGAKLPVVCDASGRPLRGIRFTAKSNSLAQHLWDAEMSVLGCMLSPNATIVEIDCGGGGVIPALALYLRALAESQQNGLLSILLALDQRETRKRLEISLGDNIAKWVEEAEADEEETASRYTALGDQSKDLSLVDAFARLHGVSVVVWSCEPGKAATRVHHTEIEESKESADLEGSMETHLNLRVANEHYTLLCASLIGSARGAPPLFVPIRRGGCNWSGGRGASAEKKTAGRLHAYGRSGLPTRPKEPEEPKEPKEPEEPEARAARAARVEPGWRSARSVKWFFPG